MSRLPAVTSDQAMIASHNAGRRELEVDRASHSPVVAAPQLWGAAGLVLLGLIAYVPLVMKEGVSEKDSAKIHWAIARGVQTGAHFACDVPFYGLRKNPGYYQLFFWLYPSSWPVDWILATMNYTNAAAVLISVVLLYELMLLWMSGMSAFLAAVVVLYSPAFWNLAGYGHPQAVSFCLLVCGWLLYLYGARFTRVWLCAAWLIAALVLGISAVIRGEMLLGFAALLGFAVLDGSSRRQVVVNVTGALVVCLAAGGVYLAGMYWLSAAMPAEEAADQSLFDFIRAYLAGNKRLSVAGKGLAYWAIAAGPAVAVSAALGALLMVRHRKWPLLAVAAAIMLPALAVFLPDPGRVSRYFVLPMTGVAILAVYPFARMPVKWQCASVFALMLASYASSEAAYPVMSKAYAWYFVRDQDQPVSLSYPLRGMVAYRWQTEKLLAEMNAAVRQVGNIQDRNVFALGDRSLIRLGLYLSMKYPTAGWSRVRAAGLSFLHLNTGKNHFVFAYGRPDIDQRKWLPQVAASGQFSDFNFYAFPMDEVRGDETVLPQSLRPLTMP